MKLPKLKMGLVFAAVYLAFAAKLFYSAMTCGSMMCDLEAWPVIVPFGIIVAVIVKVLDTVYFFGTSYTEIPIKSLVFIVPTMIGNAVCYYWVGVFVAWIFRKLGPKKQERV